MVYSWSEHSHIHFSLPSVTKTLTVNPTLGIIKLNMSCTATSSYPNLITLLNIIMDLTSEFGNHSSQLCQILYSRFGNTIISEYEQKQY